jgi:hypothetical protein
MELFPPMPLTSWQDTKATLHRFCQVIGKIRLAASVRRNHWWNVPFHLTGRGITTRTMGQVDGNPIFTIDFDFIDHQLRTHTLDGRAVAVPLQGQSVASFHDQTLQALAELGITVAIAHPYPFDLPDADRPFADDTEHANYDPAWASRYWQVLGQVNLVLEEFAARYAGKVSPVHHFWHTFDIAHTRFSDRHIDQPPTARQRVPAQQAVQRDADRPAAHTVLEDRQQVQWSAEQDGREEQWRQGEPTATLGDHPRFEGARPTRATRPRQCPVPGPSRRSRPSRRSTPVRRSGP